MKNLNGTELIKETAAGCGESAATVEKVLRAAFDVIGRHVMAGFKVNVTNFGTWYRSSVAPRTRTDLATGEEYRAPRTNYPRFRYAPRFRDAITGGDILQTLKKRGQGQAK